jgi:hypothetical protein
MRLFSSTILSLLGLLIVSGSAQAHHSLAMFDRTTPQTLEGTVKDFEWTNPHCRLWMMVQDKTGEAQLWGIEGSAVSMLGRAGWSRKSINPGDRVQVTFFPLKDGRHGGFFYQVVFPDGKTLYFRPGSEPAVAQ